jgi:hypothetical protein
LRIIGKVALSGLLKKTKILTGKVANWPSTPSIFDRTKGVHPEGKTLIASAARWRMNADKIS